MELILSAHVIIVYWPDFDEKVQIKVMLLRTTLSLPLVFLENSSSNQVTPGSGEHPYINIAITALLSHEH